MVQGNNLDDLIDTLNAELCSLSAWLHCNTLNNCHLFCVLLQSRDIEFEARPKESTTVTPKVPGLANLRERWLRILKSLETLMTVNHREYPYLNTVYGTILMDMFINQFHLKFAFMIGRALMCYI